MNEPSRPLLIVVSGKPGSGKSTLAQRLGDMPRLRVETSDGYRPGLDEVARFCWHRSGVASRPGV